MQLIYVDDYGNTGDRLDDPKQPLFALYASFVPVDDGSWLRLEQEIIQVMREIQVYAWQNGFTAPARLHMVDLYQRSGKLYRSLSVDKVFAWIERVLEAMTAANVKHLHIVGDKPIMMRGQELRHASGQYAWPEEEAVCKTKGPNHAPAPLYDMFLPRLFWEIDRALEEMNEYGIIFLDQQQGYEDLELLNVYRILRHQGMLKRILETPIYRDGRVNTLLAVPDIAGFIQMGLECDQLTIPMKKRPMLEEWQERYLLMNGAPAPLPGWFETTREKEFMTGLFHDFRKENNFGVVEAMDLLRHLHLKAVPKTYKPPSEDGGLS